VGPRTCLEDVENRKLLTVPGLELRPIGRPGRSQSWAYHQIFIIADSCVLLTCGALSDELLTLPTAQVQVSSDS
jgi:hypothetical protein